MPLIWQVTMSDFVWGDLSADEEAARIASKHPYKHVSADDPSGEPIGMPPAGLIFQHSRGSQYEVLVRRVAPTEAPGVPYLVTHQYGARNLVTGVETWAPLASEGPARPDITVGTVRDLCGIIALERKVAALEAQNRQLHGRVQDLEAQHVKVRTV